MSTAEAAVFAALGTTAVVLTRSGRRTGTAEAAVRAEVAAVDLACSRFRDDAELVGLNRSAGRWVEVGPLLFEAVAAALTAARQTGGAVDPTLGASLHALGYDRDFAAIDPSRPTVQLSARPVAAWTGVGVDARRRRLRVPPGVALDLGATAKALAADRAAAAAARATGDGVLVGLGGDLATAGAGPEGGWTVRIAEDHAAPAGPDDPHIRFEAGGVATSSTTVRAWTSRGRSLHHLLDPTTGRPSEGPWRTATVAAATCLGANTASTAAIVLGHRAPAWLAAAGLPSRLVGGDGRVVVVGGWPPDHR